MSTSCSTSLHRRLSNFMPTSSYSRTGHRPGHLLPAHAVASQAGCLTRKFRRVDTQGKAILRYHPGDLLDAGYKASTAWCFSRGDLMIDEYIIDYDDYIGAGAGSVSFLGGTSGQLFLTGRLPPACIGGKATHRAHAPPLNIRALPLLHADPVLRHELKYRQIQQRFVLISTPICLRTFLL